MKRIVLFTTISLIVVFFMWAGFFYYKNLRGVGPAITKPPADIVDIIKKQKKLPPGENTTDFPLMLPDGFEISIFASDLQNVRDIAIGPHGLLWTSETKEGTVSFFEVNPDGSVEKHVVWKNLSRPHGLVFDEQDPFVLYIAEEDKISRTRVYSDAPLEKLIDLPTGGRHYTRTLEFDQGGVLLVSIGSSCDTCYEEDEKRGTIQAVGQVDGEWLAWPYATGLRNAVFIKKNPETGDVWATEMGRDLLGDDLPPDEINIVRKGKNYGWPICYGQNIHDTDFDDLTYIMNPCHDKVPSHIDLPAHVAPLGLDFIPAHSDWPEEYWGDLLVAYHGSWNRAVPVGYSIARFELDEKGNVVAKHDFISGWLTEDNKALGRPVDILVQSNGVVYISDDKAGVIYKVKYIGSNQKSSNGEISNFDECIKAGNPAMESYPRQCRAGGQTFVEDIGNEF